MFMSVNMCSELGLVYVWNLFDFILDQIWTRFSINWHKVIYYVVGVSR